MADQTFRACYDSIANSQYFTSIVTNVTAATGYEVANLIDGDRQTRWKVPDAHSTDFYVRLEFSTAVNPGLGSDGCAVGFANGDLFGKGITQILYEVSNTSATTGYSTVWTMIPVLTGPDRYPDHFYVNVGAQPGANRWHRVTFETTSGAGPIGDVYLGELFIGGFHLFDQQPHPNMSTQLRVPSSIADTESGSQIVIARNGRTEEWGLEWVGVSETVRNRLRAVFSAQQGRSRPFMLYTHRHTGTYDEWATSSIGTNGTLALEGRGGAYFVNFRDELFDEREVTPGVHDISLAVRRTLSEGTT